MIKVSEYFPEATTVFTPRLLSVAIEPTNTCNLRCKMCYSQNPKIYAPRKKGFMSWELYKKIIDELSTFDYRMGLGLNFGGESLLHDEFIEMLKYASIQNKFYIGFTTNGIFLNDEINQSLIENKIDNITVSLDGIQEVHESARKGSKYLTVKNNIQNLLIARGDKPKPKIHVNMMITQQTTEQDINDFKVYWQDVVDSVQVYPGLSETLQYIETPFFDTPIQNKYCRWPFSYMAVLWNGDVTTCCHDINGRNVLGNVTEQSITQIWKSDSFASLRYAAIRNHFDAKSICYKCNTWRHE